MSLVGQKAAVVSFGISCQTTLQIDDHVELIKHAVGDETLKSSSLPFDAVLTHPISTAQMLDADTFYPASKDELVLYKRSEEHTSELQSQSNLVCRLLLE